jgi:predicted Na+-dependent transporter
VVDVELTSVTYNLRVDIARGDVALSVLMTTVTTIAGIFTTPLLCKTILGAVVPVDAVGIAISCLQVILAPIVSSIGCSPHTYIFYFNITIYLFYILHTNAGSWHGYE